MTESEHHDDALADALRHRAGPAAGPVGAAHDAVLARAGTIRRRRAAAVGGATLTALVVGGLVIPPRSGSETLTPQGTGDALPSVDSSTTADETTTTSDVEHPTSTVPGQLPPGSPTSTSASTSTSTASVAGSDGTTTSGPTTGPVGESSTSVPGTAVVSTTLSPVTSQVPSSTSGGDTTTSIAPTSTDVPTTESSTPAPFTETYSSIGGSITVDWDGTGLSLISVSPEPGFVAEIRDNDAVRIRVEFDDGDDDARIDVRFTGDDVTVEFS